MIYVSQENYIDSKYELSVLTTFKDLKLLFLICVV